MTIEKKPDPSIREAMGEPAPTEEETPMPLAPKAKRVFDESMSPTIGKLAEALAKAQGAISNATKDKQGYGYKYLQLPTLIDMVRKPLTDNNIALVQAHELITGKNPSMVTHTTLMHSSGEWMKNSIEILLNIMPQLSSAQIEGVAATYGRRYSMQAMCLVAAEDDTDATKKE